METMLAAIEKLFDNCFNSANIQLQNFPGLTVYGGKDGAMVNHFVKDNESFNIGGIKVTGTTSVKSQLTQ